MTDREAQDYAKRGYAHYRESLVKVYPELVDVLTPEYDQLRPNERKVWDAVGVWVAEQVYDAVEDERMHKEYSGV